MRRPPRPSAAFLLLPLAACGVLRPEDTVAPTAIAVTSGAAADYPGAAAILAGFDLGGEATVRHGDRVLYGVDLVRGDQTERRLLLIEARRDEPAMLARVNFSTNREATRPPAPRICRAIGFALTLMDADGRELERSRIQRSFDYIFQESFVAGIAGARTGDQFAAHTCSWRLVEVAKLLDADPILAQLLRGAARIPWDPRLLFGWSITLDARLPDATDVDPPDPVLAALGPCRQLPFDLYLNGSLLVRLSAVVGEPHGPAGTVAGILTLRAQQADAPERQVRMRLLAARRGPQDEWQARGALVRCGATDAGTGLAFSPDGRWLAWPGEPGEVELRDLRREQQTTAIRLAGPRAYVASLAFVDPETLLVARDGAVECWNVGAAAAASAQQPPTPVAVWRSDDRAAGALAVAPVAGQRVLFVGFSGAGIERWTLPEDPAATPRRETVRAPEVRDALMGEVTVQVRLHPQHGWLLADDDPDRCRAVLEKQWWTLSRQADDTWHATGDGPADESTPPDPVGGRLLERVAHGRALAAMPGRHGWAKGSISITERAETRIAGQTMAPVTQASHGFDPSGRYYAYSAPGHRLLLDLSRYRP